MYEEQSLIGGLQRLSPDTGSSARLKTAHDLIRSLRLYVIKGLRNPKSKYMSRMASSNAPADAAVHDRIKLLIIEDDNVHRMIIKRFAVALGFDVAEAGTYESAITLFGEQRFDCITLDLSIQSHSGIEVLRYLWDVGRKIPVLIISGADQAKRAEAALYAESMKFDILHVVRKPLDLKALQEALAQLRAFIQLHAGAAL